MSRFPDKISRWWSRPFNRDICFIAVIALVLYVVGAENDLFEWLYDMSREYEDYELDEVFVFLIVGSAALMAVLGRNITYLKKEIGLRRSAEAEVQHLAHYDSLTGLPKRELFEDQLKRALARDAMDGKRTAVIFIDLDNFKAVNDCYGHPYGDALLSQVAQRISRRIRTGDTLARFAGDEFILVVEGVDRSNDVHMLVDKILGEMEKPFLVSNIEISVSLSIGIVLSPDDGRDVQELYRKADTAMYQAKEDGKSTYRFFSRELESKLKAKLRVRQCLESAIEKEEFRLVYQPLVDVNTGKVVSCEALLRWSSQELGVVQPEQFIPIAEEAGLMSDIGAWVLDQACAQLSAWQRDGLTPVRIAVNLSYKQLTGEDYISQVQGALNWHQLSPSLLEVELTEKSLLEDLSSSFRTLQGLRDLGVTLTLDDFGEGYSSVPLLQRFRLDRIKIDSSLVARLPEDSEAIAIVNAMSVLAHSLGMEVIAEGVESEEQLRYLQQNLCNLCQGYVFGYPMEKDSFEDMLRSGAELST